MSALDAFPTPGRPRKRMLAVGYVFGDTHFFLHRSPHTGRICWTETSKERADGDVLDFHYSSLERLGDGS